MFNPNVLEAELSNLRDAREAMRQARYKADDAKRAIMLELPDNIQSADAEEIRALIYVLPELLKHKLRQLR